MVKTVLVTGSEGFIGQQCIHTLIDSGIRCIGLDKKELVYKDINHDYIQCDLSCDMLEDLDTEIDCLIHLAGVSTVNALEAEYQKGTVDIVANLLNWSVTSKVRKIVILSSNKIDDESSYGRSKSAVESMFEEFSSRQNIPMTILRSAIVFGKGMNSNLIKWAQLIIRYPFPCIPESSSAVNMIGIQDLCDAIAESCFNSDTDNKKYYLSDGYCYRINDIENRARELVNKQDKPIAMPRSLIRLLAKIGDIFGKIGLPLPINSGSFRMLFDNCFEKDDKFYRDTGLKSKQNFIEELPEILGLK